MLLIQRARVIIAVIAEASILELEDGALLFLANTHSAACSHHHFGNTKGAEARRAPLPPTRPTTTTDPEGPFKSVLAFLGGLALLGQRMSQVECGSSKQDVVASGNSTFYTRSVTIRCCAKFAFFLGWSRLLALMYVMCGPDKLPRKRGLPKENWQLKRTINLDLSHDDPRGALDVRQQGQQGVSINYTTHGPCPAQQKRSPRRLKPEFLRLQT